MQPTGKRTIQVPRGIIFGLIVLPLVSGSAAFLNMLGNPRFQDIRNADVMRLIAIGICLGMEFSGLLLILGSKLRKG
jgi:hypothetical protein